MAEPASSPRRIEAARKRREALRLRIRGASFTEIAEQLGYGHKGTACAVVREAVAELGREEAEQLRDLELARLDAMQAGIWDAALAGQLAAIDRVLKIMERRAKLCGLDEQRLEVLPPVADDGPKRTLRDILDGADPEKASRLGRALHDIMPPRPTRAHPTDDGELN